MPSEVLDILSTSLDVWSISLTLEQSDRFARYAELLVEWNETRMNLTRMTSPTDIAIGHLLDSLAITQFHQIPLGARIIDIGSGPGFPGLAIKILRPDIDLTLLEATAKKLTFCSTVATELGLQKVTFQHGRAEEMSKSGQTHGIFDIVTARAVAPMPKLLPWTMPFVKQAGAFIAWKGPGAEDEMREASDIVRRLRLHWRIASVTLPADEPRHHKYIVCQYA